MEWGEALHQLHRKGGIHDIGFYAGGTPNLGFNVSMSVFFGLILIFHITVFFPYKQWWFGTCFLILTTMETLGYIGRIFSHYNIFNKAPFIVQYIGLTIAPVFTMAGVYYQLAKLSMVYGPQNSRLRPMAYSYIFIGFDILSIFVQIVGGGVASASDKNRTLGTHIFVAGLALQVFSMTIFFAFWFDFLYSIYLRPKKVDKDIDLESLYNPQYLHIRARKGFKYFNLLLTIAVFFVYIRCCYRVAELAEGWDGRLVKYEVYFIVLDLVMMLIANLIFIPFYPGFMFDGRRTNIGVQGFKRSFRKDLRGITHNPETQDDVSNIPRIEEDDVSNLLRSEEDGVSNLLRSDEDVSELEENHYREKEGTVLSSFIK